MFDVTRYLTLHKKRTFRYNTWDARLNYSTDNTTLIDEFITDICRLTLISMCNVQNGATACDDRITSSYATCYNCTL